MTESLRDEAPRRAVRSVPPAVSSFDACITLLARVEEIPRTVTGALTFDDGLVLVERQRVCWAITSTMGAYLTDLLCENEATSERRRDIEDVYRSCKKSGARLSESLLESGLISEVRLRLALREHNCEAIVRLSQTLATPRLRQLGKGGFDDRFSLTPVELLAAIGARSGAARAQTAADELAGCLVEDSTGVAFVHDSHGGAPTLLAAATRCELPVNQVLTLCRWASDFLSLGIIVDSNTSVASASRNSNTAIVTWRSDDVGFAALCATRAASARLLDRVGRRSRELRNATPRGASP
ncbi:MAG: hypothetical protein QM756_33785 [Polyangiaceae bacterium]